MNNLALPIDLETCSHLGIEIYHNPCFLAPILSSVLFTSFLQPYSELHTCFPLSRITTHTSCIKKKDDGALLFGYDIKPHNAIVFWKSKREGEILLTNALNAFSVKKCILYIFTLMRNYTEYQSQNPVVKSRDHNCEKM